MWAFLKRLEKDEAGGTAIEYALIASMIFLAIVSVLGQIGSNLASIFVSVNGGFAP